MPLSGLALSDLVAGAAEVPVLAVALICIALGSPAFAAGFAICKYCLLRSAATEDNELRLAPCFHDVTSLCLTGYGQSIIALHLSHVKLFSRKVIRSWNRVFPAETYP